MERSRVFKLRLAEGVQTFRLDEDSVDYDWKGTERDFHGTLPYENLRLKERVTRRDKVHRAAALMVGGILLLLAVFSPYLLAYHWGRLAVAGGAGSLLTLANLLITRHVRGGTISFQIEPRVFGFAGEMPVPDTKAGRQFLTELEEAWKESLRRRFLVHEAVPTEIRLKRIAWLQFMGVLAAEEADAERSLVDSEAGPEPKMIGFAVN